jgi:membrane-bound metal-dependent hydrolase YbcI (DUF457 family)
LATPVGHTLIGLLIARRLGVRSPLGMAAAVVGASLPDADVVAGVMLHRDAWKLHRQVTHTPGFALGAGMLAGFAGLLSAGNAEGERDLIADALTGAAIVGSHILLDRVKLPSYIDRHPGATGIHLRNEAINGLMDALVYGPIAWLLWPKGRRTDEG